MRPILLLAALAGCTQYARVHMKNAPGLTDLSAPMDRENGDPAKFEESVNPGSSTLAVFMNPSLMLGAGREDLPSGKIAYEPGIELRFERHSAPFDDDLLASKTPAITAGIGFAQLVDGRPTVGGPLFAEFNYRLPTWNKAPTDIGLGPVVYPANFDIGGQLTVRFAIVAVRARYMADGGLELWGGFQIPIPFFFGHSR